MVRAVILAAGVWMASVECSNAADELNTTTSPAEGAPGGGRGLVGYWSFDERKGDTTKDSSQYGNVARIVGAKWSDGAFGSALEFNGVSDFVNMGIPGSGVSDKAVSVEAWVQPTGNNANANLVFAGPESLGFGIWIQGGKFFAGLWNSTGTQYSAISASSPTPGRWYHVAMTCDFDADKVIRFYINGVLDSTCAATGTAVNAGHKTIDIGGRTPNAWYFNGIIDEVKIYNRALTEEEIGKPYAEFMKRKAEGIDTTGYHNSPWIWSTNPEQGTVYFRKSFNLPALTGKKVYMICDGDNYQVFLNGEAIVPCLNYSQAQILEITGKLRSGRNVIAAQATNKGGKTGFFTYIGYPRNESPGEYVSLASGEGMKCTEQFVRNWHTRGFDDSKWSQCQKIAGFSKRLAFNRNFPDLGRIGKDVPKFTPPDFQNSTTMRVTKSGLTLVLQHAGKQHSFRVEDSVTHEQWFMPGPPFLIDDSVSAWDGSVSCEPIDNGFRITSSDFEKYPGLRIAYTLVLGDRTLDVTLEPIRFPTGRKFLSLSFPLDFGAARSGEDGYLVSSIGNYDAREGRMFPFSVDLDRYRDPDELDLRGESTMPFFGIVRHGHPCAAIITDFPATDYELRTVVRRSCNGVKRLCSTTPIWSFEEDRVNGPRHLTFQFLESGGYVEIAKAYRRHLVNSGRFATLRERVKQRPACLPVTNASFFWGAYSLGEMPGFIAKLKGGGIEKAVLHVANRNDFVGAWKRWPEGMTAVSGTAEEFRSVAAAARKEGYGFSPVDEYTPFADRGSDYDAGLRAMRRDGGFYSFATERCFFLCDSEKIRFAKRDLPRVKEVIGECPYLLDCEGCSVYECFDPRHPLTSREQILARRAFLTYVRDTMGCVVSEGSPIDWLTDVIDVGHGHSIGFQFWESKPGAFIPLWSLVYGGAVVDLFRVPGAADGMLYAALYGLNARFDEYEVGKTQLEWHKRITNAWPDRNYFELADHQFLTPLVQKSRFRENGKVVEVIANFGDVDYRYGKQVIPPRAFQVFPGGAAH